MGLFIFQTRRVRDALKAPAKLGVDALVLLAVVGIVGGLIMFGRQVTAARPPHVEISLSLWALPKYTLFSLARGMAAYILSLIFTLVYGTISAHNRRAERVMIPILDIMQAIPVLAIMPVLILAMVQLFPGRQLGLELACIIEIFTAQVWNMTFSFHGSLKAIPTALREAGAIQRLSGWQIFRILEVPAAMIGLVWNSMMSMAGGWFFLMVNEAFSLNGTDYTLPGIGSYMSKAVKVGDGQAKFAAIVAMVVMILVVDQLLWRPIVVWSQRFKLEEQTETDKPQSWALNLMAKSRLWGWVEHIGTRRRARTVVAKAPGHAARAVAAPSPAGAWVRRIVGRAVVVVIAVLTAWGVWSILRLLWGVPLLDRHGGDDWVRVLLALLASFARVVATMVLGTIWTLPVGIFVGLRPKWSRHLQPVIQVVASFPAPMLFPMVTVLLVLLHVPFTFGCVLLMLLGAQWYILFNVIAGSMAIPADLKEVSSVYRMSTPQRWWRLYIPCVFPYLLTGLITAAGGAWNATIVAEIVSVNNKNYEAFGLGAMITKAANNPPIMAAAVVTMAAFVVLINRFLWKWLYRLAEDRYSLNV